MDVLNDTDYRALATEVLTAHGERLLTVVKGTFVLRRGAAALSGVEPTEARPIREGEVFWLDPLTTPPKYPSDLAPEKPASDVIVVAKGHAPSPVPSFDVAVRVGRLHKALRIFGLRAWQQHGAGLSKPRPVMEQEIRYDMAFGGQDLSFDSEPVGDLRNPVGRGVVRDRSALSDQLAPCVEDPDDLILHAGSKQAPAGFGPLGPHWLPRRNFMGTYDERWQREQAPLPPGDLDPRHYQCASPGLTADPPLAGGEPVELRGLTLGGGTVRFALPTEAPRIEHEHDRKPTGAFDPHIDTVIIDTLHVPDGIDAVVELCWRSLTPMPRRESDASVSITPRPIG